MLQSLAVRPANLFNVIFENSLGFRPIFDLLVEKDPQTGLTVDKNQVDLALKDGLDLGAAYSETIFNRLQRAGQLRCSATNCNESSWEREWAQIFNAYNSKDAFYLIKSNGLNGLVTNGNAYAPR